MATFFVGGSQRAGTTLLQQLLCQDKTVNPMIREASYFRVLVQAYHYGKHDFTHDARYYFDTPGELRDFHRKIIAGFIEHTRGRFPGASNLVLKDPLLTMYFPEILELVDDVLFVIILRDPRDAIASMVRVGDKLAAEGEPHFFQQRNMKQLSSHYKKFYIPALTRKNVEFKNKSLIIRYEDLVSHTDKTLEILRRFTKLELPWKSTDILGSGKIVDQSAGRYRAWYARNMDTRVHADSIGRYTDTLTDSEITIIEQECQMILVSYQYENN